MASTLGMMIAGAILNAAAFGCVEIMELAKSLSGKGKNSDAEVLAETKRKDDATN